MKVGIDIEEVVRIEKLLSEKENNLERIFTKNEILYCNKFSDKANRFAGFFCAKEAFSKALGTGFSNGVKFSDIEVVHSITGAPEISEGTIKNFCPDRQIALSISHTKNTATAICIIY